MAAVELRCIRDPQIPQPLPQVSPQCLPFQTLLVGLQCVPLYLCWGPRWVAENTKSVLCLFKEKKKMVSWSPVIFFSPQHRESPWCRLLDLLIWVLQEYPLCGLCGLSCCMWVLIVIGLISGGSFPPSGWLRGSTPQCPPLPWEGF